MKKKSLVIGAIVIGMLVAGLSAYAWLSAHRYDGVDGSECMRTRRIDQACGI